MLWLEKKKEADVDDGNGRRNGANRGQRDTDRGDKRKSGAQSNGNDLCLYVCRDAAKQGDF